MNQIIFVAEIAQIKTMADGSYRITLDLGENEAGEVAKLLPSVKRRAFSVAMVAEEQ
jgi:hypothetical protein